MRKKGLVERIVMRNPADKDFSSEKLPNNRADLFWYMLKNKLPKIYKTHLLLALFFLPLVTWAILTMSYSDWLFSLEPREGITHLVEYWFTVYVTAIPLWMLAFVGLAGGLNVFRKLAWSDPVVFKADFLKGVKSSGKQLAFVGFLWGTAFALVRYAIDWLGFYYAVFDSSYPIIFGIFVCYFLLLVLIGLTVYMCCMSSLYNVTSTQLIVGAFKLYFSDFFRASGVIILCLSPMIILLLLGYAITTLLAYLLPLLLLLGIMIIPMMLVCHRSFDRVINKKDYPAYYGRGLSYGVYPSAKADEESDSKANDEKNEYSTDDIETDFERVSDDEN